MRVSSLFLSRLPTYLPPLSVAASPAVTDEFIASGLDEAHLVKESRSSTKRAGWARTERLFDANPNFVQRNFHPRQHHRDQSIIKAFGSATPHSGNVLLHYAGEPPADKKKSTPVLLVHGATKNGNFFLDPKEDGSGGGPVQRLREEGFDVYAVSFAHNQDDNYLWSEQIANAIAKIKEETGADQVDLIGHSKGALAARMYTSDVRQDWMTSYRGDVRRLVLIGAPNGGIDYSFRHSVANYALGKDDDSPYLNAPMSWDTMIKWGQNVDMRELGFSSKGPDYWPGQRQMLARWDDRFGLPKSQPDWYTTYHGGQGFVSSSRGVDHFIEEGGNLIEQLNQTPIDPSVEVAVLAGDKADIEGILNEYTGPSDGIVFVESALMMPEGTNIVARDVLHANHKALVSGEEGQQWLVDVLSEDSLPEPKGVSDLIQSCLDCFELQQKDQDAPDVLTQLDPGALAVSLI